MRVLISQPMANKTDAEVLENWNKLKLQFDKLHIDVLNNIFDDKPQECNSYYTPQLFYLARSINLIGQVDAVYFAEGWKDARGCLIERQICEKYGVKILEKDFLNGVKPVGE